MLPEIVRWSKKVRHRGTCWIWIGSTYRGGYGHFRRKIKGKWVMYKAHRYSYELHTGHIPAGLCVLHTCDNPSCVNPEHLFLGTYADNNADKVAKGRGRYGVKEGFHKLSWPVVDDIRKKYNEGYTYKELEVMFNTSKPQISRVIKEQTWKGGTQNSLPIL